jgi:two-component system cell cycle response regulator
VKTFNATVVTANHEIKQPLTLINLSTAAIRRELNKNEQATEFLLKRVEFIEKATHDIIDILEKLSSIKKPIFIDYLNNLKMINLQPEDQKESVN